jgi:peptidyl-prolyl cis-trans isomerase D
MLKTLQQRNRMVKIVLGVLLSLICLAMVITLVPGPVGSLSNSPDVVANVGGQDITMIEVRRQLDQITRNQSIPPMLKGFYARRIMDDMIFERALELEAKRLGLQVTPEEQAERIKQLLPMVFNGDTWVGKDRYTLEVEQRTGMSVEQFEEAIRQSLLEEKFQQLITAGITVSQGEVEQEFRRRNEKVKIEYALVKPADLVSSINPTDAELEAYFNKNSSHYPVPEKRSAQFALLDLAQLRQKTTISDDELRAYYNAHLDRYKVQDRVHVEHILFKTVGKTDAEIAEIRKQAEDVLKKANHGGNFEDLAKKYSEDTTKDKGGDLGWIVRGQTVPAFEQAAFTLPKGAISDLVKTEYGFHIIKVLDKETAHTKPLEEVRASILSTLLDDKVQAIANRMDDEMASTVRQSSNQSLDQFAKSLESGDPLARQCLVMGMTPPATMTEPIGDLGNSPELHDDLFRLRPGELSLPLRLDRGYVVLAVKQIEPAHPASSPKSMTRCSRIIVRKNPQSWRAPARRNWRAACVPQRILQKRPKPLASKSKPANLFLAPAASRGWDRPKLLGRPSPCPSGRPAMPSRWKRVGSFTACLPAKNRTPTISRSSAKGLKTNFYSRSVPPPSRPSVRHWRTG